MYHAYRQSTLYYIVHSYTVRLGKHKRMKVEHVAHCVYLCSLGFWNVARRQTSVRYCGYLGFEFDKLIGSQP